MKITLVMAMTADGKIALEREQTSVSWTSKEDTKFFVQKTKEAGVLIMGKKTFDTIGKPLAQRRIIVMVKPGEALPARISTNKKNTNGGSVEFTHEQPAALKTRLEKEGVKNAILAGGAVVNGLFLKENLIDEIFLTVEPVIFGRGIGLFELIINKTQSPEKPLKLKLANVEKLNDNVMNLHYKVL